MLKFDKHVDGQRRRARRAARDREEAAQVSATRAKVVDREGGLCRARLDGAGFPWCTSGGTDFHEESGLRGMGGRSPEHRPVTTSKTILTCHACHMAHHNGVIHIEIEDADQPFGVWYRRLA
jgi:hypothetical protein